MYTWPERLKLTFHQHIPRFPRFTIDNHGDSVMNAAECGPRQGRTAPQAFQVGSISDWSIYHVYPSVCQRQVHRQTLEVAIRV